MRDLLDLAVVGVTSVTIRAVAGHGDQAELVIQTKRGALNLRLIPRPDTSVRITDMRARDRRRNAKATPLAFPFDVAK